MLEGDYIPGLWIPPLCKLCCSCGCNEANSVGPEEVYLSSGCYILGGGG